MIHDFTYLRPANVKEALSMLNQYKDECKVICGGQSLLIVMRQGLVATDYLIDIKNLRDLRYITFDLKEGLKVGATTTHREIEKSSVIRDKYPALAAMETKLASTQTRNWGTIGGNLAHADPCGDPAPVLISMKANIKVGNAGGERTMAMDEFFADYFETVMEKDEMILEIQVPVPEPRTATAYKKFNLLSADMGIVGAASSITLNSDGTCKDVRVVLGNAGPTALRLKEAEDLLVGKSPSDALFEQIGVAAKETSEPVADIHASEEFRRHLLYVLTKRTLKAAYEDAKAQG
jgi:aerobic carbon-monoxide dehydrogenase medium subunit